MNGQDIPCQLDSNRDFDHGVFVPLKLMYSDADIPIVQISMDNSLSAEKQMELGKALRLLSPQNILIIGSGSSFHNLSGFFNPTPEHFKHNLHFETWLEELLNSNISEIRIFSRDEKKQDDMRKEFNNSKLKFYIGDVRDPSSIDEVMHGADYVFHAAALKQVPSCEFHPIEAVKTNILGTDNVLTVAQEYEVERVVVLSTDKAAYPINAMGMTKAIMEKVMVAKSRVAPKGTVLCGTRYGNVMGSRGSVIPLFKKQIRRIRY